MKKILSLLLVAILFAAQPCYAVVMIGFGQSAGEISDGDGTLAYQDNFNSTSDGDMAGNWTGVVQRPVTKVSSYKVVPSAASTTSIAVWTVAAGSFNADQKSCTSITASNTDGGVVIRSAPNENSGYHAYLNITTQTANLRRMYSNSSTSLQSMSSIPWAVGDRICASASGTNPVLLKVYRNGTQINTTYSDSDAQRRTSGQPGVLMYNGSIDDWKGYNL